MLSFIQKERVYAGILFMPHLNPYLELGYGIGTHLFDFGVFVGNEKVNLHLWDVNLPSSCSIDDNLILYVFFLYFLRKSFFCVADIAFAVPDSIMDEVCQTMGKYNIGFHSDRGSYGERQSLSK